MIQKKDLDVYRKAIMEALVPVGQEHELEFRCGDIEYGDLELTIELKGFVKTETVNGEKEMFKRLASKYGFRPDDYGKEIVLKGERFRFIGFNYRARVNKCILLRLRDEVRIACNPEMLHVIFEKEEGSGMMESGTGKKTEERQQTESQRSATFFVAECMEMYNMGEFCENLTVEEAVAVYDAIPSERMNGIKGIGVVIHTKGQPHAADAHYDLMRLGELDPDILEYAGYDKPLVEAAYQELKEYLDGRNVE